MVEIKSVKVDNWGVFFLQKLQNFFNKTDYCDLTLQFNDNSQLKVHRLVLSACTDYFNVLEQSATMMDDILVMPRDLQADVVVPIVNFMYTGTLEFEVNMYVRLLKTARDMNMTVLLKLLEAHKKTVEVPKHSTQPILLNKQVGQRMMNTYSKTQLTSIPQRTYTTSQRRTQPAILTRIKTEKVEQPKALPTPSTHVRRNASDSLTIAKITQNFGGGYHSIKRGPSRFDFNDEILPDTFDNAFDNISYESKPLITASLIKEEKAADDADDTSASFERLRQTYSGAAKRTNTTLSSGLSPVEKKPNIEDVKEYTEAHRMRKEIVAEEFENEGNEYVEDTYDDAYVTQPHKTSKNSNNKIDDRNESGNINHAKIISEVLKKYPHLVKNNKNIKLKVMHQKGHGSSATTSTTTSDLSAQKSDVSTKLSTIAAPMRATTTSQQILTNTSSQPKKIDSKTMHALIAKGAANMEGPWLCLKCGVNGRPISIPSYKGFRRHLISVHDEQIDPKICAHCGYKAQRKYDLYHHALIKHGIKPPTGIYFPRCQECDFIAKDNQAYSTHIEEVHNKNTMKPTNTQHCIYCNKTFAKEIHLYSHMRNNHKDKAREDGVMDFSDEEQGFEEVLGKYDSNDDVGGGSDNKIKIISNITLPTAPKAGVQYVLDPHTQTLSTIVTNMSQQHQQLSSPTNISLQHISESDALSNITSTITLLNSAQSDIHRNEDTKPFINSNELVSNEFLSTTGNLQKKVPSCELTKFVTEEGSELQLTPSQKEELLQQLQGEHDITDGVVMVLNDEHYLRQQPTDIITNVRSDDQNIVVVYNESSDHNKNLIDDSTMLRTATLQNPITEPSSLINWQSTSSAHIVDDNENVAMNKDDGLHMNVVAVPSLSSKMNEFYDATKQENQKFQSEHIQDDNFNQKSKLISALEGEWSEDDDENEYESEKDNNKSENDKEPDNDDTTEDIEADIENEVASTVIPTIKHQDLIDGHSLSDDNVVKHKNSNEISKVSESEREISNILVDWQEIKVSTDSGSPSLISTSSPVTNTTACINISSTPKQETPAITIRNTRSSEQNLKQNNSSKNDLVTDTATDPKKNITKIINDWEDEEDENE